MEKFNWRVFDEENKLEVAHFNNRFHVRRVGTTRSVVFNEEEWNQLRRSGPDPEIMEQL